MEAYLHGGNQKKMEGYRGLSVGKWEEESEGKIQRISSINCRYKVHRGRLSIV